MPNHTNNTTGSLVGHWCLIPDGEYTLTGEITLSMGDYHLVRIHPPAMPGFSQLMSSEELCADDVMFFDSEAEMQAFLSFTPDDGKPRVVAMR